MANWPVGSSVSWDVFASVAFCMILLTAALLDWLSVTESITTTSTTTATTTTKTTAKIIQHEPLCISADRFVSGSHCQLSWVLAYTEHCRTRFDSDGLTVVKLVTNQSSLPLHHAIEIMQYLHVGVVFSFAALLSLDYAREITVIIYIGVVFSYVLQLLLGRYHFNFWMNSRKRFPNYQIWFYSLVIATFLQHSNCYSILTIVGTLIVTCADNLPLVTGAGNRWILTAALGAVEGLRGGVAVV